MAEKKQFILLPREGLRATSDASRSVLLNLPTARSTGSPMSGQLESAGGQEIDVLDSISEDGPKLVSLDERVAEEANAPGSPVRAAPIVFYDRPNPTPTPNLPAATAAATQSKTVEITCKDEQSGKPVKGAHVVAFSNYMLSAGDSGYTNASGKVKLTLTGSNIERLYVYAPAWYWGAYRQALPLKPKVTIQLTPVDLSYVDCVRDYYGSTKFDPAVGVKVGIVDSGVGPHQHLNLLGGTNTVTGEPGSAYEDGDTHGTHVAGLVGANATPPAGLRGVAPNVELLSYRVFGAGEPGASNYAILKAMIVAGLDECDIINLSLGGGPRDEVVEEAVQDARNQGMLVVVAAGNGGRRPVDYPAAYPGATAVSAMGKEKTFPSGSLEEGDIQRPPQPGTNRDEFVAGFSNIGPEIAVTGLGVGTLSTLPNDEYGPMSGTSMAAPVVAGTAASLLSQNSSIYGMARDHRRSGAIEQMLQRNCVLRGFGQDYEGYGLPNPAVV